MTTLSTKTCLITGGASGLGKAIATRFLAAGANVIIADINPSRLQETFTELLSTKTTGTGTLKTIQADITSSSSVEALFAEIAAEFPTLDVLVNNAGIMDRFDPVGDLDEGLWERVLAVNLTAPFLVSKFAVRRMLEREVVDGCVLNIASTAGVAGGVAGAAYTASKHGLLGLTKNTASFYGSKGIRCNALLVGGMGGTNISEAMAQGVNQEAMGRTSGIMQAVGLPLCEVDEVAELCLSLTAAKLVNGACIPVDRGWVGMLG